MIFIKQNLVLGLALASYSCLMSNSSFAARQVDLSKESFPVNTQSHALTASPSAPSPVRVLKSHTDSNQITHVRLQQMHANYRIWGADAVVHVANNVNPGLVGSKSNNFLPLLSSPSIKKNGIFYVEVEKDLGNAAPQKYQQESSKTAAFNALKQDFLKFNAKDNWNISSDKSELLVYVDENNKSHWAYLISFTAVTSKQLPKQPTAIIDAETHTFYKQWDNVKTFDANSPAIALGYGGNPLLGQWRYGKEKPSLPITRDATSNLCFMKNEDVVVVKKTDYLEDIDIPGTEVSFNCPKIKPNQTDFREPEGGFFGQFNDAYSPINDALYSGMVIKNMYKEWFNVPVLTDKKGSPLQLSMNILYEVEFENAFWDSDTKKMYFGLGSNDFFPFVTLGIASHEISHGFTDQHSNLVYQEESGSINESFSDMAISVASYYDSKQKDIIWGTGSEIIKNNLGKNKAEWVAFRYFDNPNKDGYSIDNIEKFPVLKKMCFKAAQGDPRIYQNCIVHLASGIYNKVFYNLANSSGMDAKSAFAIMIKANQDYWTSNETFQSAACGVKNAAIDVSKTNKNVTPEIVEKAFLDVGISLASC